MTIFIDREDQDFTPSPETAPAKIGATFTRKRRPTSQYYDLAEETYTIRRQVPDGGNAAVQVDLEFPPGGLEVWNSSYQPVLVQMQNFGGPWAIQKRYDWSIPPKSFLTVGYPQDYACFQKLGYYVEGIHSGLLGVVTFVICKGRRETKAGTLLAGVGVAPDCYEANLAAGATTQVWFAQPATGVEFDTIPDSVGDGTQSLVFQPSSDPNGLSGSDNAAVVFNPGFTLPPSSPTKGMDAIVTCCQISNPGATEGRYSIQALPGY
jgi:hypothetical protein